MVEKFEKLYCECIKSCYCDQLKDEKGVVCSVYGEMRSTYNILVEKPEGKRPLGGPRRRWEDNIKMDVTC
jgi:hypothetical protein